jgi:hypothetical protein
MCTNLMMNVVVIRSVLGEPLERVPRQRIPAMIVDRLEGANSKEERSLADGHPRCGLSKDRAARVEDEAFYRVVVKRPVGIGDVQPVMDGM